MNKKQINYINEILINKLYHNTPLGIEIIEKMGIFHMLDIISKSNIYNFDRLDLIFFIKYLENLENKDINLITFYKNQLILQSF